MEYPFFMDSKKCQPSSTNPAQLQLDPPVSASDEQRFWGLRRRQSKEINEERESEREKKNKRRERALAERAKVEAERGWGRVRRESTRGG
ncbi:hypothetical protein L484_024904 [Morus notabilis]|uniref:Uncharacterized protein n=1 Tax=Morus notabilis TaxID=981085 RepID=W9RRR6_9ROSA|nr:hypothetical protein L484_024904 [Morus notabilis]